MEQQSTPKQYRQGDFFFVEVTDIPEAATVEQRDHGKAIVGYGEATGHHHAIAKRDAVIRTLPDMRWLEVPTGAKVTHQEHNTITLPPGKYRIVQERTYHAGNIQRVVD